MLLVFVKYSSWISRSKVSRLLMIFVVSRVLNPFIRSLKGICIHADTS